MSFDEDGTSGTVTGVRAETEYTTLSTAEAEILAFAEVAYDRIQAGLESPNTGPMTLTIDIVRAFDAQPGDAETGVVVAGVANVASVGTMTVACTGW